VVLRGGLRGKWKGGWVVSPKSCSYIFFGMGTEKVFSPTPGLEWVGINATFYFVYRYIRKSYSSRGLSLGF
jgi:hypothetical protein